MANNRDKINIAAYNVAKSCSLQQAVCTLRYGSLININSSSIQTLRGEQSRVLFSPNNILPRSTLLFSQKNSIIKHPSKNILNTIERGRRRVDVGWLMFFFEISHCWKESTQNFCRTHFLLVKPNCSSCRIKGFFLNPKEYSMSEQGVELLHRTRANMVGQAVRRSFLSH